MNPCFVRLPDTDRWLNMASVLLVREESNGELRVESVNGSDLWFLKAKDRLAVLEWLGLMAQAPFGGKKS
jgi:hypothetical protein